jgi:uroporphyrinogen-III synthase
MSRQDNRERSRSSTRLPLKGVRVLVGRARHQASALSEELRKMGADVIEIPFIEIRKPRSFAPLDSALRNLKSYDWLILTSVNGVEAMWERLTRLTTTKKTRRTKNSKSQVTTYATANSSLRVAAIGPATKKAIEERGMKVDLVPKEYVAESVVRSLKRRVKGKRVLLVRAKVARDVIPHDLRRAGAHVDVVEAYETVVPQPSRKRLRAAFENAKRRPHVITFTSSSTVRNFVSLLGTTRTARRSVLDGVRLASIGPVTSSTLREFTLPVDIEAAEFTIPGLVQAIVAALHIT